MSTANFMVEHLATFSTSLPTQQSITPKMAIQRLFAMEKTSGIWTQRMTLKLEGKVYACRLVWFDLVCCENLGRLDILSAKALDQGYPKADDPCVFFCWFILILKHFSNINFRLLIMCILIWYLCLQVALCWSSMEKRTISWKNFR